MPELPETETIARDIAAATQGLHVTGARVVRQDVLRMANSETFVSRVVGERLGRTWRRAKSIVVPFESGAALVVTPRFTGALQVDVAEDPYLAIALELGGRHRLDYRDVRRLGTVALLDVDELARWNASLGPEPLEAGFTGDALSGIVRGVRAAIKTVLMDQRRLAGVGNIYANESLWMAGVDPSRPAATLTAAECHRLRDALVDVLERSIAARGTTFRDYRDASGGRGSFAAQLAAYGRGGAPCHRCGTRLTETHAIDGRTTVLCHRCQR